MTAGNAVGAQTVVTTVDDTSSILVNYWVPERYAPVIKIGLPVSAQAIALPEESFDGIVSAVDSRIVLDRVFERDGVYLANSMNSLRVEGQKTVGIEIVQQFDWEAPEVIIIPGGNLGNVSALGKGLLLMKDLGLITKLPRIVVAQAERADPVAVSDVGVGEDEQVERPADAVGQADVHDHEVGPELPGCSNRLGDRARLGNDLEFGPPAQ